MTEAANPFHTGFVVEPYANGSFVLRTLSQGRAETDRYAFTTVTDLTAFLSKASGSIVNPMQPSFDFRDHLKGEPTHGPAS